MLLLEARCKNSGLFFKNFFDMLVQLSPFSIVNEKNRYIKQACFKIDSKSFQIYTNVNHSVWVSADYESSSFYKFNLIPQEISIGVSLEHLKNFFKNARKQDDIVFEINGNNENNPETLTVHVIKEKNQDLSCKHEIKVQIIQSEHVDYEERLNNPIHIKSSEFTSLCRSIYPQPGWIDISFTQNAAKFYFNIQDVVNSTIQIGDKNIKQYDYTERYNASYIRNINKLASFSVYVKMYATIKQPLVFETKIDFLGTMRVYIKSNNQILEDNY